LSVVSIQALADEEIFGELILIDKSNSCLQLGAVCYEISSSQRDSILAQATRLREGTPVMILLQNRKVVEIGRAELLSDEHMPN
jgi:hypothetical protein